MFAVKTGIWKTVWYVAKIGEINISARKFINNKGELVGSTKRVHTDHLNLLKPSGNFTYDQV
jgi:hypothetical protein